MKLSYLNYINNLKRNNWKNKLYKKEKKDNKNKYWNNKNNLKKKKNNKS
jgi:hypothetical protein